ncbi:MAG: 50S ribosome-binding GTPase [Candidatus Thorarchaeota archaeon]|jgi:small GTP-binding protein
MPANVSPEYNKAQAKYLRASSDEERLLALEEMISHMPTHKGAESLRANLRTRYKKLKQRVEKGRKKKTGGKEGIRKEGVQVVLIGLTNSGKSCIVSALTNASPKISEYMFTTKKPVLGTLDYQGVKFQMIDMPSVNYETFDQGIANTADILLVIITKTEQLDEIFPFLRKSTGKKIVVVNKSDLLRAEQKRKIEARLRSKKYDFVLISCKSKQELEELKEKLFENSGVIRIFTKEPRKPRSEEPVSMPLDSNVQDAAEKIFKKKIKIKEARVTGPSSKFPNQKVSLKHKLRDKDTVEFYTE